MLIFIAWTGLYWFHLGEGQKKTLLFWQAQEKHLTSVQ
jgi:hypothetical protein